jgi:CO/xanthine dehydrogenase Mo-binding subunit
VTRTKHLGKPRKIIDGLEKITGTARYVADVQLAGMLYARPVLSPYPHARITAIHTEAAKAIPGVVAVLTGRDLNPDRVAHSRPTMILAQDTVVFAGQPVAVVVAQSEAIAQDAASLLEIDYDALLAVTDVQEAISDDLLVWPNGAPTSAGMASVHGGEDSGESAANASNIEEQRVFERGDVQVGFASATVVIERTYTNAWVHQAYMEPHAVVAEPGARPGEVTVYTSTQGQYVVRNEVSTALGLRERDVKVVPMTVGGGFGAKYGILDPLVVAVALKVKKPVKMVLTRTEDMLTTMPAPGTVIDLKIGATQDGRISAIQVKAIIENGVFKFGHAGIIATIIGGMYKCDNVRIETLEVVTHKAPTGAYRAPGVPQALFALESSIDELARALGHDVLEFRDQNAVEEGDLNGTGRPWPKIGLKACLERAREHPIWKNRSSRPNEGVGLAIGGWPGAFAPAGAVCRVDTDGTVRLHVGSVDISGVHSSMVLIAAETLGVHPDNVEIVQGTTDSGPFAPSSGGSQVTISLSGAVLDASTQVKDQLLELAAKHFEAHKDDLEIEDGQALVKGVPEKSIGIGQLARLGQRTPGGPGPVVAEGRAAIKAGAPGFTAQLVRVRVDPSTGHVTPLEFVTIQDVGFALNPMLVEGQMQGGGAQGLSMGLYEGLHFSDGNLISSNFLDYAFPRAEDLPPIEAIMVQQASESGPFGARIVGEPPITAGAAAVANAIRDAVGVRVTELPVKPEVLWTLMQARD